MRTANIQYISNGDYRRRPTLVPAHRGFVKSPAGRSVYPPNINMTR